MATSKSTKLRFALITEDALNKLRPRSQSVSPESVEVPRVQVPDMKKIYEMISANVSQLVDQRLMEMNFEKMIDTKIHMIMETRRVKQMEQDLYEVRAKWADQLSERRHSKQLIFDANKSKKPIHNRPVRFESATQQQLQPQKQQQQQQPQQKQHQQTYQQLQQHVAASEAARKQLKLENSKTQRRIKSEVPPTHQQQKSSTVKQKSKRNSMMAMATKYLEEMEATRLKYEDIKSKLAQYMK